MVVQAAARFVPESNGLPEAGTWMTAAMMSAWSLPGLAVCGLPLALVRWPLAGGLMAGDCAWRGDRGGVSVRAMLGPVAIAVCALPLSAPVWDALWWLAHNG